jgi:hypothetical protein
MLPALPTPGPLLAVTARPTAAQYHGWWQAMHRDDLRVAYTDAFPPTLAAFRRAVAQGDTLLLLCLVDDQVAGAMWLHDLRPRRDGSVAAGWVGGYFLPAYRGPLASRLWHLVRQHWEGAGIAHLFCAVHVANRLSQVFVTRAMQFHRVGRFPAFAVYHGQPADLVIYTLHPEDTALAWDLATARAARQVLPVAL